MIRVVEFDPEDMAPVRKMEVCELEAGQAAFYPLAGAYDETMSEHRTRLINGYKARARTKRTTMTGATFTTRTDTVAGERGIWVCRMS